MAAKTVNGSAPNSTLNYLGGTTLKFLGGSTQCLGEVTHSIIWAGEVTHSIIWADPSTICNGLGPLKFEASIPTTIYSTYASHEAIHQLFAMVREPSNLRGRFQQLFAAHSPPMRRSINYLQWFGHPQIGGVGSNNYLQHIRLPQGDPSTICNGLGPLQFEGSIITTICSTFASHQAIHPLVAMV